MSEGQEYEEAKNFINYGDGASAAQPSSPLINKDAVVGKDVNSGKKKENESSGSGEKKVLSTISKQITSENSSNNVHFSLLYEESLLKKDTRKVMSKF